MLVCGELAHDGYCNGDGFLRVTGRQWTRIGHGFEHRCALLTTTERTAANVAHYGRLYNWYAVDNASGLCPSGWHVPTDGEWMVLEMELG